MIWLHIPLFTIFLFNNYFSGRIQNSDHRVDKNPESSHSKSRYCSILNNINKN
jgi:hypothetical protein